MLKSYNDFLQVFELKCKKVNLTKRTGVNFIKVGRKAQIIEIAKSIYALRLHPTFEKLFTGVKEKISVRRKTVYEIDPLVLILPTKFISSENLVGRIEPLS